MWVINAPSYFTLAWAAIKGFLDERTVSKIHIVGGRSTWGPRLLELMGGDASRIPREYGGTLDLPGGLFHRSATEREVVGAGKEVSHVARVAGGVSYRVKWLARPGDVKFSLSFTPDAGGAAVVLEPLRSHPKCDTEWVTVVATAPADGSLTALWDNKAGWRQRELLYRIEPVVRESEGETRGATAAAAAAPAAGGAGAAGHAAGAPAADLGLPTWRPVAADTYRSIVRAAVRDGPFGEDAWAALAASGEFPQAAAHIGLPPEAVERARAAIATGATAATGTAAAAAAAAPAEASAAAAAPAPAPAGSA